MSDKENIVNSELLDVSERKLVVLDVDETLVHSDFSAFPGAHQFVVDGGFVFHSKLRPHAHALIDQLKEHYDLAIWSAGKAFYVHTIVETFFPDFPFKFVWSEKRCLKWTQQIINDVDVDLTIPESALQPSTVVCKPLSRVEEQFGYALGRIVIVDDAAETALYNNLNLLHMPPYLSHSADKDEDQWLLFACVYLKHLAEKCGSGHVGDVDKREWYKECVDLLWKEPTLCDHFTLEM